MISSSFRSWIVWRRSKGLRPRFIISGPFGVASARNKTTVAILRESFDPWERRAPLAPQHVSALRNLYPKDRLKILVQPCGKRIFSNAQYEQSGAVVTDDIAEADVILSVKRPKNIDAVLAMAARCSTFVMFSHTIKGQLGNMDVLQACLARKVQLMDWERVLDDTNAKRLVSFGRFAGLAGAIDTLHILGRKLLYAEQRATPLLSCAPAYMHESLDAAFHSIRSIGMELQHSLETPLVVAVTGSGGCVHNGVMEVLQLLPHEIVAVDDLPHATTKNRIYLAKVGLDDFARRFDAVPFDRKDFQKNPEAYRSIFHRRVVPYIDALVNCVYWDSRFPRLLTKDQMRRIAREKKGKTRLSLVSDISCDIQGSIEFLEKTTTIERPCFAYDPLQKTVTADEIGSKGITVMGLPILPTELPLDSTLHFGQAAMGVLNQILQVRELQNSGFRGADPTLLGKGLATACITTMDGRLESRYRYLEPFLRRAEVTAQSDANMNSMVMLLRGHLFDSGLINQVLDIIERSGASLLVEQLSFCQTLPEETTKKSSIIIKVSTVDKDDLNNLFTKIKALVDAVEPAATELSILDHEKSTRSRELDLSVVTDQAVAKRVLLFGAGHVAKCVAEYLGRDSRLSVIVASENERDAQKVSAAAKHGRYVGVDVVNDRKRVSELIDDADLVISMLPAPLHPIIAEECIIQQVDLVTASYESDEIRKLNARASAAGIVILNEVGLDPGLDHMSAMRIIDNIKDRDGTVTLFQSVCGGLPCPEAAQNPFKYKFSWSPKGTIRACLNSAQFRWNDQITEIPGWELLQAASPFTDAFSELGLEVLPNRNSLIYEDAYGIKNVPSIFRGTLRYKGFSSLMNVMKNIGLLSDDVAFDCSWKTTLEMLRNHRGGFTSFDDFLMACADENSVEASRAGYALDWLGIRKDSTKILHATSVYDEFCRKLDEKLSYGPGERDMVAMHHRVEASFVDGHIERHESTLLCQGNANNSAMARTVGYTTGACAKLVLDGNLKEKRGLLLPTCREVYEPILQKLERDGITFRDSMITDSFDTTQARILS